MNNWNALLFREIAVHLGVSPWQIYRVMRQAGIARRHGSEQNYATYKTKPKFSVKRSLTPEEEQLRVTGVMLYRAEGVKTGNVVDFVNSDPLLIKLFMAFLRRVCGIAESRLRILLYCYADQDIEELKQYWIYITGIPREQFTRPFVRPLTPNVTGRKMPWGLVHIRYSDKRLLELILQWSEAYGRVWAGT